MASAVNATAQEARLSIWVVLVRVRPRPFIASVASIPPAFLPGSHPASIAERAAQGCIRAHCAIHDWENRLVFVMAGLDPAINERKPADPRVKPGDDGLELVHPEYVAFEYASAMIGELGPSCRRDAMPEFEKRRIGRTSLEVTVLGLGCATLGGTRIPVTRQGAEAIVRAAWAAGVRYVDTAPYYGFGQAERCVGDALRAVPRNEWVLSTKVGRLLRPQAEQPAGDISRPPMPFDAVFDYSYDAIIRSFEDSL